MCVMWIIIWKGIEFIMIKMGFVSVVLDMMFVIIDGINVIV